MQLPQRLIKFGFFLLYNHLAFSYDLIAWLVSLGQWANWRRTALQYLPPGPILELAYGTGGLHIDMLEAGMQPIGIDLSPFMARITTKKIRRRNKSLTILRSQAQNLPFPSDYFTSAVATFPTNYIFEEETLKEINRVLRNDADSAAPLIIVMQGQLKSFKLVNNFIDWLYEVTGQNEDMKTDLLLPFKRTGFEAQWQTGQFQSAFATLIVARKLSLHQEP